MSINRKFISTVSFMNQIKPAVRCALWALLWAAPLLAQPVWAQTGDAPKAAGKVDPQAEAKAKLEIVGEGELRLDGKITAILGAGSWQMEATSWTSPRGVNTEFEEPKNKGITVSGESYLHPRGELDKVPLKEVKLGSRIAVIGKNGPDGMVVAREVVLQEGYGSRKTVGSLSTNPFTLALVKQSREARDAGQLPKAMSLIEKAIVTARGMGDISGEGLATQDKALLYVDMEQPEQAYIASKRVETLGRTSGNTLLMALGMRGASAFLLQAGKFDEAIALLKEADSVSTNAQTEIRLGILSTLSAAYLASGQLNEGVAILNRVQPLEISLAKESDANETSLAIAMLQSEEKPDAAHKAIEDSKQMIERARDEKSKAGLLGATGLVRWRLDQKEEAKAAFTEAAQIYQTAGDAASAKRWSDMATDLEGVGEGWQEFWLTASGLKKVVKPVAGADGDGTAAPDAKDGAA
jgi:tetratricopeptide (TPR) repeat protein